MMGIRKPIPEFVVAPKIVIATVKSLINIYIIHAIDVIPNVHIIFCYLLSFVSLDINNCSIESFDGRTQNGDAKNTTKSINIRQIIIILF